jgi:hypothetical protein
VMHPGMKNAQPQFNPVEVPPHILKQQKAKHKPVPGQYASDSDSGFDSLSDASFSAADSVDGFKVVSHSRSRSRGKTRPAQQGISRDPSRGRAPQVYHEKTTRGRVHPDTDRPPLGKYSDKSPHKQSPRTSHGSLPPQQINIEVNTAPPPTKEQTLKGDRNNVRGRDQERVWEQSPRPHDRHRHDRSHNFERVRRPSYDRSMSRSPRQSYNKFEKFPRSHSPMSLSTDRDSDTIYDDDGSSILSSANDSVFSQSLRSGHMHRGSRHYAEAEGRMAEKSRGHYRSSNEEIYPALDPRKQRHHSLNEMPEYPRRHHRNRGRHSARHSEGGEWSDDADTTATWPPTTRGYGLSRRNSTQVPNPFDTVRYPPQRSHSYVEPPLSHTYPPYATPAPKALPQHARHDSLVVDDLVQATIERLNGQQRSAADHIHSTQQRRPLGRSTTFDPWSNGQYAGGRGGQRQSVTVLPDGRTMYQTIV